MEQRCQEIVLVLDKMVVWGVIELVGVLLGVSQKHRQWSMTICFTEACQMVTCTDVYLPGGVERSLLYLFNISLLDKLWGPIVLWVHYYHITSFQTHVAAAEFIFHLSIHISSALYERGDFAYYLNTRYWVIVYFLTT